MNIALGYSEKPLRMVAGTGIFCALVAFVMVAISVLRWWDGDIQVAGYTSIIAAIWLIGGLMMFSMGVVGLYVGQVFRNVIDNALSFSPAGSKIVVELSRAPRNGPFIVTIDDEGPGIPEDNLESIFNRFNTERPSEQFGQHSGLGLSICRQIMETYGGAITASNRRGADGSVLGARFTIRVPSADARP